MLAKLTRSLERKREGKTAVKYRFDVHVVKASGTFTGNPSLRVIWTRGSKVQMTDGVKVDAGIVRFDQALSQVATLYKDHKNAFESKEYTFKLQMMGPDSASKKSTLGKGTLDLSQFASIANAERTVVVPLVTLQPQKAKGLELHLTVTSIMLKGVPLDDGMSTISGFSAVTSTSVRSGIEQDLTGFDGEGYRSMSESISALTVSASTELSHSLSEGSEKSCDSVGLEKAKKQNNPSVMDDLNSRVGELEAELQKQALEKEELQRLLESQKRQSDSDLAFLKRELESERFQKSELENQLVQEIDEASGQLDLEEALRSAIAPYELRYNKLVEEFQETMQQCNADIDGLHEELLAAKDENAKLGNLLEASERARESLNVEKRALEVSLIGSCSEQVDMDKERKELREELTHVDEVMQELIQTKLDYAELCERQTITKREMLKLKEKNLQLASKITKMETYLYYKQTSRRCFSMAEIP